MKRLALGILAAAIIAAAAPASAYRVDDPIGAFTDSQGNAGYVEVDESTGTVRACNENEAQPMGDDATGYIWVNPNGNEPTTPTYGTTTVGAGDHDGEGADDGDDTNGTEGDDCP